MNMTYSAENSEDKTGFLVLIKRLWPNFLIYNSYAFTVATLYINILIVARIMWPIPNAFTEHAGELGILTELQHI